MQIDAAPLAFNWTKGAKLAAKNGECIEIAYDGRDGTDLSYLTARAMVMQGVAIMTMSLPSFAEITTNRYALRNAERIEETHSRDYLMVLGSLGDGEAPYPAEKMYEVEWALRGWMLSGKPLMLQGSQTMRLCRWWSEGFKSEFLSRVTNSFQAPVKLQPIIPQPRPR